MVIPETDKKDKHVGIRPVKIDFTQRKERPEKRHYFKFKEEHNKALKEKCERLNSKSIISEEFKVLSRVGFSRKTIENIGNNALLGVTITKDLFNNTTSPNRKRNMSLNSTHRGMSTKSQSLWKKIEQDKLENIKREQESIKKDMDYVRTLPKWENAFLPKLK